MKLMAEEEYLCLSDDEILELRQKENRCIYCGTPLKIGIEEYECWGRIEKVNITYCPRC